jgi:hypothetical protein
VATHRLVDPGLVEEEEPEERDLLDEGLVDGPLDLVFGGVGFRRAA